MKSFRVEWDRDYGINHRTGWSIVVDGSVIVELEPWLAVAVVKATVRLYRWREAT